MLYLLRENEDYHHVAVRAVRVINAVTNAEIDLRTHKEGEDIDMCTAIQEMLQEGREEGREAGRQSKEKESILNLNRLGILTPEQIAAGLAVPLELVRAVVAEAQ